TFPILTIVRGGACILCVDRPRRPAPLISTMKRLTARSILRRLRASATTLCVSGVLFPAIGLADGPAPAGRVRVGDRPAVNARPAPVQTADMRLYYIATPWSKVLEN